MADQNSAEAGAGPGLLWPGPCALCPGCGQARPDCGPGPTRAQLVSGLRVVTSALCTPRRTSAVHSGRKHVSSCSNLERADSGIMLIMRLLKSDESNVSTRVIVSVLQPGADTSAKTVSVGGM